MPLAWQVTPWYAGLPFPWGWQVLRCGHALPAGGTASTAGDKSSSAFNISNGDSLAVRAPHYVQAC